MSKLSIRLLAMTAVLTASVCCAHAAATAPTGETTSLAPSTGISESGINIGAGDCTGMLWYCVADPIGYPNGSTTYLYTNGNATHVVGFSAPSGSTISSITSVTMHIVAASYSGGSGTVTMSFYNNGSIAGQGSAKTIASGSPYTEYVSGIFTTSISDISNLTMQASFTGDVAYTAIWIDLTYGPGGTTPNADLEKYMCEGSSCPQVHQSLPGGGDLVWNVGSCTTCAGGNGFGSLTVTPNASSPAPHTSSTKVGLSASANSGTASALEWVRMDDSSTGGIPIVASVTGNWLYYVSSETNLRSLEFDQFWGDTSDGQTGNNLAMWGTHCNFTQNKWELDAQDGTSPEWQPAIDAQTGLPIPCNLAQNQWHQITWQVHQDPTATGGATAGRIFYDYLTIDGTTHIIAYQSKARGYAPKDPGWNTLGIQTQQDLNDSSAASVTEYVDAMSVTYW